MQTDWGNMRQFFMCNFPLVHPTQLMMKRSGGFVFQIQIQNCQHSQILLSHENMGKRLLLCTIQTLRTGKKIKRLCSNRLFWIFYLEPWKCSLLGSSRNKACSQRFHKEVNVSQIIKRANHEVKTKENKSPRHLQRNGATPFAFRAPKAGE